MLLSAVNFNQLPTRLRKGKGEIYETLIADRRRHFVRGSSDLKEELMLLRLETAPLRCCLTEVKKQADLVAKFSEYLKSGC